MASWTHFCYLQTRRKKTDKEEDRYHQRVYYQAAATSSWTSFSSLSGNQERGRTAGTFGSGCCYVFAHYWLLELTLSAGKRAFFSWRLQWPSPLPRRPAARLGGGWDPFCDRHKGLFRCPSVLVMAWRGPLCEFCARTGAPD